MTFDELMSRWTWEPIRNCPGRFVLGGGPHALAPEALIASDTTLPTFDGAARDPVVVGQLEDGGVISYRRDDGTYVHTLNTAEGFARKLQQLGIADAEAASATARRGDGSDPSVREERGRSR